MIQFVRRYATVLVLADLVLAWFLILRPTALGGPASFIFVSGVSMLPTLGTGDLVVLQSADAYERGDVVAFRIPEGAPGAGSLVIHRIVGGSATDGFVMRGDNKPEVDEWRPAPDQIAGRLWLRVPGAGTVVAWLKQPAMFAGVAAALVVFFIVLGGKETAKQPRDGGPVRADG